MRLTPGRRSLIVIFIISAAFGGLWLATGAPVPAQPPKGQFVPPPPRILAAAARADTIAEPRTFVGTVHPVRRSLVGSAVAGRVEEYLINEGDRVQAGQPIAQLRRGLIQAELDAAKADLAVRQAELAELEKSHQDEIDQAQARLTNAQALLTYRQSKAARSKALGTSVAKELYEEDSSLATQAVASVREHQAALRLLTEGARELKTEQARARFEVQKAEVQRLQELFDRHIMYAPFDGFVSAERTEIGQWVMQGDPVAEVVELGEVEIEIMVLEDFIAHLDTTVEGPVEVSALAEEQFTGRVAIINPQANTLARTFPVKVRVANRVVGDQPLLRAGMLARVTLPVGKPTTMVLVPKDAVVLGGPSPTVYVATTAAGKSMVRPVPVTLGPPQGAWIAVRGEVKEGDQVIVEGNERLRPMQEVRVEMKEVAYP
jgi:RND family efflux transporter MFP subunit